MRFNNLNRFSTLLLVALGSPLLMAPSSNSCPSCVAHAAKIAKQKLSCFKNRNNLVTLTVLKGTAELAIEGTKLEGLSCETERRVHTCTFTSLVDGPVTALVTSGRKGAIYNLEHTWSE